MIQVLFYIISLCHIYIVKNVFLYLTEKIIRQ